MVEKNIDGAYVSGKAGSLINVGENASLVNAYDRLLYGSTPMNELRDFINIVKSKFEGKDKAFFFEFGTNFGLTSFNVANIFKNTEVYTLDIKPDGDFDTKFKTTQLDKSVFYYRVTGDVFGSWVKAFSENNRIHQIYCDSALFNINGFDRKFDVIYIDGSHTYEYVKNDSEKAFKMIKDDGMVIWHDYCSEYDVKRYIDESGLGFFVHKRFAVCDFTIEKNKGIL